jgi:hypothetical protein
MQVDDKLFRHATFVLGHLWSLIFSAESQYPKPNQLPKSYLRELHFEQQHKVPPFHSEHSGSAHANSISRATIN